MEYDIEGDLFRVRYRPAEVEPDRIQGVIVGQGQERGLPYRVMRDLLMQGGRRPRTLVCRPKIGDETKRS